MPLFGDLNAKRAISRLRRTLGTLVTSGVPILQVFEISLRETPCNSVIAAAIFRTCTTASKEGESIVQLAG